MKTENKHMDVNTLFDSEWYLYFYQNMLKPEKTEKEVEFLCNILQAKPGDKLLDIPCGHGRHAVGLAQKGLKVTGYDLCEGFLKVAEKSAAKANTSLDLVHGDMRELDFNSRFDFAIQLFTAFGYFDDDTNLDVLKRIRRALKPGGRFCIDFINRDIFLKHFLPSIVHKIGDDLMIDRSKFDIITGRNTTERIMIKDGERRETTFSIRFVNYNEMERMLQEAGFRILNQFGGWDENKPVDSNAFRIVIVAEAV